MLDTCLFEFKVKWWDKHSIEIQAPLRIWVLDVAGQADQDISIHSITPRLRIKAELELGHQAIQLRPYLVCSSDHDIDKGNESTLQFNFQAIQGRHFLTFPIARRIFTLNAK